MRPERPVADRRRRRGRAASRRRRDGRGARAPRARRRRRLRRRAGRRRARVPPAGHRRCLAGRAPADAIGGRPAGHRLQRRDLQLPRSPRLPRARGRRLPRRFRHRGHRRAHGPPRRARDPARAVGHVRDGGVGHARARAVAGARSAGQEAALLRPRHRRRVDLRLRAEEPARVSGLPDGDRSRRRGRAAAPGVRPGAGVDLSRHRQAAAGTRGAPHRVGRGARRAVLAGPHRRRIGPDRAARAARRGDDRGRGGAAARRGPPPHDRGRAARRLPLGRPRLDGGRRAHAGRERAAGQDLLHRLRRSRLQRGRRRGGRGEAPGHRPHRARS